MINSNRPTFRRIAALVVASAAAFSLAACSGGARPAPTSAPVTEIAPPSELVKLDIWAGFGGPDAEIFTSMVKAIDEAEPNLEINLVMQPEYDTKVRSAAQTGTLPHGGIFADPVQWAVDGFVSPMTDFPELTGADPSEFPAGVWDHAVLDGERYGVPFDVQPVALFWNKALFEEAGLDPDHAPADRDEFVAAAKAISSKTKANGVEIPVGGLTPLVWTSFAYQGGMEFADASHTTATFNDKAGVESAEFLRSLIDEGLSPANVQADAELSDFVQGKNGLLFAGVWETTRLKEALGDDLGGAFLPAVFGEGSWGSSQNVVTFARDMSAEERSALYYFWNELTLKAADWAVSGSIPARASVRDTPEFQKLTPQSEIGEGIGAVRLLPNFPGGTDLLSGVGGAAEAVVAYLQGGTDIQASLDEAAARYTKILQDAR